MFRFCSDRSQTGMTSLLVVSGIVALVMFLSISDSGILSLKKESVLNTWDTSKAQMNANEGVSQLRAFFNSLDHNRLSLVQAQFENPSASLCNDPKIGPVGSVLPRVFRPIMIASRTAAGDKIEIYASLSHREDYCHRPEPGSWKLNYRVVGSFQCDIQGAGACARHELFGSMIPSESFVSQSCTAGQQVCEEQEVSTGSTSSEVSWKTCGQNDAYEFKPLNLRTVGGFTMGEVYSGAVSANPNRITDPAVLWKAPVTVTGNIINGTRSSAMLAEGLETNLAVSFSENALFMGTHNMPPLPYYKPLEIGGRVIARSSAPASGGQNPTTGVGLKVLGATPSGSGGALASSASGPLSLSYSYLNHPSNPGKELSPDLLDPNLLQQTAGFSRSLNGTSDFTNASYLNGLKGQTDRLLKHFLGLDLNEVERVSRAGTNVTLNSMLPIEVAQRSAHGLFTGSNATTDEQDWRKVGVVYYYVDVRSQGAVDLEFEQQGQVLRRRPVYSSGQGGSVGELNAQPPLLFCEQSPNVSHSPQVNFEQLVQQHNLSRENLAQASQGSRPREPQLGCEVALERQNAGLWQQIKDRYEVLQTAKTNAQRSWVDEVAAARDRYDSQIAGRQSQIDQLAINRDAAQSADNESRAAELQSSIDQLVNEKNTLIAQRAELLSGADSLREQRIANAEQSWNNSLNQMNAHAAYRDSLESPEHKKNRTIRLLVENPRWANFLAYRNNTTPRWIRDHWNNPVNNSGGCFAWDTTVNRAPCSAPFSGAQSMLDNAVVVIDARGTDGVYWRHLEYPAAQLIIVLGTLYVEDVILNANVVVDGDLVVLNRGFAVAPRRWWGIPRYKKCSAELEMSGSGVTGASRENTNKRMGGLFYFFTDRTDQVRQCIVSRNDISQNTTSLVRTCRTVSEAFCVPETRTVRSRLEPSIRFFER